MNDFRVPIRPSVIWAVLVIATAATFWVGTDRPFSTLGTEFAPALTLALAFVKAALIGNEFMEIRGAPRPLRMVFAAWVAVFATATALALVL
ncbi:MAG: cytochrome C oxidase subunit IV family protein [Actinomycetes bacterium]